jgi:spore coat polysaccharide biosynthesis protein SpsF
MCETLGIVEFGTSRFLESRNSVRQADRRFGDKPLLQWVIRRVTESLHLDQVIVLTDPNHEALARALAPQDVAVFASRAADLLSRYVDAIEALRPSQIVRVTLDHPFVDPTLIDRLITTANKHPGLSYIGFFLQNGQHAVASPLGVFAEWCTAQALIQADRECFDLQERDSITRFIYSRPEQFSMRLIPAPQELDRDDLRLRIDHEEDWEHAQTIIETLGVVDLDWRRITDLLKMHPDIRQRMAVLNAAE